jgi:putative PIN family toxin of toxin-antitoxin system
VRVVLDTNIVVSGLLWRGTPRRVLDAARDGAVTAYTSSVLLDELADVFTRRHLAPIIATNRTTPAFLMQRYAMLAELVFPQPIARTVPKDVDDDVVVACAIAARADLIVSGDGDLLELKACHGIRIVSALEALRLIGGR